MNYYEHHIGDYIKNTAHLSMTEDGAYRRLLDAYYTREGALPGSLKDCCKLARATSKPERDAVKYVLEEFFTLTDDGYHQARSDEEIDRFKGKQAKAKASAEARWKGQRQPSERNANASPEHDAQHMRTQCEGNAPRARPQSPDSSHQTPDPNTNPLPANNVVASISAQAVDVADWSPPDDALLRQETETGIPVDFALEVLVEFREFWIGKARQTPQTWTSRFLQRCADQHARRRSA